MDMPRPAVSSIAVLCALAASAALCLAPAARAGGGQAGDPGGGGSTAICATGETLASLGRFGAAEKAFEKELEASATAGCAKTGLEGLAKKGECAKGEALFESGEKAAAQKAYEEALGSRPASECSKKGLEDSSQPSFWDEVRTISGDAVATIGLAALCLAALALVALLAIRALLVLPPTKPWASRRFKRPSVTVESLDDSGLKDKLGVGTTALLREGIELSSEDGALKMVSGEATAAETWIGKVSELGEQGKIAATLLGLWQLMLPRQHVKVTGALHPAADPNGHGISLELHREIDSRGSTTLWASRFSLPVEDSTDTVHRLAVPAAAWTSHAITKETKGENLASGDPHSWALFKAGIELQRERKSGQAARLYEEALSIDKGNYGALTNLALIEAGLGNHVRAIPRLRKAKIILELD
jgi:tetratricopeptide (TPR) repeat protein